MARLIGSRGSVQRYARWAAAVVVTIAAFAVPAWLCGAVVLPTVLRDPAIRWGLTSALGAALAALAAMWGYGFAARSQEEDHPDTPSGVSVHAAGERSVAIHGNPAGAVSTGDTGAARTPSGPAAHQEPPPLAAPPTTASAPGAVSASGERSIAIRGNPGGDISTGDRRVEGQA